MTTNGFRGPFIPFAEDPPLGAFILGRIAGRCVYMRIIWARDDAKLKARGWTHLGVIMDLDVGMVPCHRWKRKGCHMKGS